MSRDLVDDLGPDGADGPLGGTDPQLVPTAALLRDVLAREGERVQPSPDGLARIRAAIAAEPVAPVRGIAGFRRGAAPPRGRRSWMTALAAAASVVVLAGAGVVVAQNLPVLHKGDAASVKPVGPAKLPVYEVGTLTRDGRVQYRLFREFYGTAQTTANGRLSEALTQAVIRRPDDQDYVRVFGGAGGSAPLKASWDPKAQVADVELTPAMTTVRLASDDRAFVAIQQIVYTATAVLNRPDAAVRITVRQPAVDTYMFGRTSFPLGGMFYRARGTADPTAPVVLVDPSEGSDLGRGVQDIAVNVGSTARDGVVWTLTRDGTKVAGGVATVGFAHGRDKVVPGNRGVATISVDHRVPGLYELTVSEPPSAGSPPWTDSRTFVVN